MFDCYEICRDDRCGEVSIHLAHDVRRVDRCEARWLAQHTVKDHKTTPWGRPSHRALVNAVARATSATYPRHCEAIYRAVRDDYGTCTMRSVQRTLKVLVERGHVLRVDLGSRLYAYLRPGSRIADDVALIREQVEAAIGVSHESCFEAAA